MQISIVTSLFLSDRYLDALTDHLKTFAKGLLNAGVSFEVIVIANKPTLREQQFGKDFSSKPWFRFIPVELEPLYASWNRGVEMAKGEVVGFWNADDVRYFEGVVEADQLFKNGAQLVY